MRSQDDRNGRAIVRALRNPLIGLVAISLGVSVLVVAAVVGVQPVLGQSGDSGTCTTGAAVPDPANNPGLVSDCEILLASRDTLAGDATLNWSADTPIAEWEGVTLGDTQQRVTELGLRGKQLTGEIPASLNGLVELQKLHLGENQLSGGWGATRLSSGVSAVTTSPAAYRRGLPM